MPSLFRNGLCNFHLLSSVILALVVQANLSASSSTLRTFSCRTTEHIEIPPGRTVRLAIASQDRLCTLTRVNEENKEVIPVGRSYHNQKWEAVAGPYRTISYECNEGTCVVKVPEVTKAGDVFQLRGYDRNRLLSQDDEVARFFEQASFGVTTEDLKRARSEVISDRNSTLMDYFAKWIDEQISVVEPTSHRGFWRERTSPVYEINNREGRGTLPCDKGSRWRSYAFSEFDRTKEIVVKEIEVNAFRKRYALEVDGKIRTMVDTFALTKVNDYDMNILSTKFTICKAVGNTFRLLRVKYRGECYDVKGGNPPVDIRGIPQPLVLTGFQFDDVMRNNGTKRIEQLKTKNSLRHSYCLRNLEDNNFFISVNNGASIQDLIFEPHLILEKNSRTNPLEDGGKNIVTASGDKAQCANTPRTFLNEAFCRLSKGVACISQQSTDTGTLEINAKTLQTLYEKANKFVYAITALRVDSQHHRRVCVQGVRIRWRKVEIDQCIENTHFETAQIFRQLFHDSRDNNPFLKDIYLPFGKQCHLNDRELFEMTLSFREECWKTTHPDDLSVYDFSKWAKMHPGGGNAIRIPARRGRHTLSFPVSHDMLRWVEYKKHLLYVGRLGDSIEFHNFPYALKTEQVAESLGFFKEEQDSEYALICGSPYETSNESHISPSFAIQTRKIINVATNPVLEQQRRTVWTMITTTANDTLRQRVAWALAQIFAISSDAIQFSFQTESFLTYYDIFVRNAFGNYRDVLKEVSFSPMMSQMLTYLESKSSDFIWSQHREVQFADENYAREIMQLFSIGLEKLNEDGTTKVDHDGKRVPTYSNDDITEYARLWTGFTYQTQRGNVEGKGLSNTIDPMQINLPWRDQLPKMGLDKKYIGDDYALCSDLSTLPSKSFLRRGAKFRLLGNRTKSDILTSDAQIIPRLDPSSSLFKLLCSDSDLSGECSFAGVVTVRQNLPCKGMECTISRDPSIVQVNDNVYYEYIRPPCVSFPFSSVRPTNIVVTNDGKIALSRNDDPLDSLHSLTYFRVQWQNDGDFPTIENHCGGGVCEIWGNRCLCRTTTVDSMVFDSLPTREQILTQLNIGALSPYLKKYVYSKPYLGFSVYSMNKRFSIDTAFLVKDDFGRNLLLKNMMSNVIIIRWDSDEESSFSFRNTPTFYGDSPEVRDALYETDAGLDHYFYHHNTAPFVAVRFIQRFGISNPSPRFIKVVSQAFKSGRYEMSSAQGGITFGRGKYGDLAAMVAAILLDSESRDTLLDFDLSFGSIREPLMKVISLMRSMNFSPTDGEFMSLYNGDSILGQMAHDIPSVFSFFLPEYSPPGAMAKASLVSPEAMIAQNSMGLVNGMLSLVNFGMTNCFGGFGSGQSCKVNSISRRTINLPSSGHLTYVPEGKGFRSSYEDFVIQDLATLLTSGRLSSYHRNIMKQAYLTANNEAEGLRIVQRLMILSPEFHQTGTVQGLAQQRSPISPVTKVCKEYKAVIHILLKGGCDSFNMLVPHSQCRDGRDKFNEYKLVRGSISLDKESLLPINASSSNQVCEYFGIHKELPFVQKLYDQGELAFLAGIGVMSAPVNQKNYDRVTQTDLFAHNKMQAEISRLDPYEQVTDSGLLGRIADVLSKQEGNKVQAFSIDAAMAPLDGNEEDVNRAAINSKLGFKSFNPSPYQSSDQVEQGLELLNGIQDSHSSLFAKTWSSSLHKSIYTNNLLSKAQDSVNLQTTFPDTKIGRQLKMVSEMIASKDCRGKNRDIFYVETGKFDHHADVIPSLEVQFEALNEGLSSFISELKSLPNDTWNNVAIVVSSDFGRTLTGNSKSGSDHGWSGNGFMIGGSINGGKILGSYPDDLTEASRLNIGRGRLIPTMPFEAPWQAVTEWLDMTVEEIEEVLPNIRSFPEEMLLKKEDVFVKRVTATNNDCTNEGSLVSCTAIDKQVQSSTFE